MQPQLHTDELEQVAAYMNALTPEQMSEIYRLLSVHKKTFNEAGHPFRGLKKLYEATDIENEPLKRDASCKKGCSFCCNWRVSATSIEAQLIYQYCVTNDIPVDVSKLEKLKDLPEQEYMFSPHKRCTFLSAAGECKIYPVRPFACRNYMVSTPAYLCNTEIHPGKTASIFNIQSCLPTLVVMEKYKDEKNDNLAYQLLKAMQCTNSKTI